MTRYNILEEETFTIVFDRDFLRIVDAMKVMAVLRRRLSNYSFRIISTVDGENYSYMSKGEL